MKPLLLTILFSLISLGASAQPNIIAELGVVCLGMGKEGLSRAGYTKLLQKGFCKEGQEEWITFLNWANPDSKFVTFYVVDDKIRGWKEVY